MTPEEARTIELSRNPIKRHRQVTQHLGDMGIKCVGRGEPFIGVIGGRNALVRAAQAEKQARFAMEVLRHAEEQGISESQAAHDVIVSRLDTRSNELREERNNNGEDI